MKAITTKYLPATNTKGARVTAFDGDGNRVTISYSHELDGVDVHIAAARALCEQMGWRNSLYSGWQRPGVYVHVFETWAPRRLKAATGYAYGSARGSLSR